MLRLGTRRVAFLLGAILY